MTDITLPYPYDEAVHVVKATFERMPNVSAYEVHEGPVIVGNTDGGLTSFGEEIIVGFPDGAPERDDQETVVTVTAQARFAQNLSANPWKHKADFIEELHELKGTPVHQLELASDDLDGDAAADAAEGDDSTTADAMRLGAKIMTLVLLGMILVVGLLIVAAWVL